MTVTESLHSSLRRRRRNTFGKAFPLVRHDELVAILDEVDRLRAALRKIEGRHVTGTWREIEAEYRRIATEALDA